MAGKEQSGVEFADAELFSGAAWFLTPLPEQDVYAGISGEFLGWVEKLGARIASVDAADHDRYCAWISHLPQMISTALAASLVDEFGDDAPLLESGGRALREMTRISASPYSMWRDIAITNKNNLSDCAVETRAAPRSHSREPGLQRIGHGVRACPSVKKRIASPKTSHRNQEQKKQIVLD